MATSIPGVVPAVRATPQWQPCPYRRAPLSMLDAKQVDIVVQELKREETRHTEANHS